MQTTVIDDQQSFRDNEPSRLGRGIERLTHPLSKVLSGALPTTLIERVINGIDAASGTPKLVSFDHDRLDILACRTAAKRVERVAKTVNGMTGAGAGLGGALTSSADIPATIALSLRNIRNTGRAYFYEGDGPAERLFRLQLLELAAVDHGDRRRERISALEEGIAPDGSLIIASPETAEPLIDQAVERVSRALALAALRLRAGTIVPVIGSALGLLINVSFQGDVSRAARFGFQARWLKRDGASQYRDI